MGTGAVPLPEGERNKRKRKEKRGVPTQTKNRVLDCYEMVCVEWLSTPRFLEGVCVHRIDFSSSDWSHIDVRVQVGDGVERSVRPGTPAAAERR